MSEGGLYPWKRQHVVHTPHADYSSIKKPMELPEGKTWLLDPQTREWKVIDIEDVPIAVAVPVSQHNTGKIVASHETAVTVPIVENTAEKTVANSQPIDVVDDSIRTHIVQKHDTIQGICLKYNITPIELRRLNCFSGSNLALAPSTLKIPVKNHAGKKTTKPQYLSPQQVRESKINSFLLQFRSKRSILGRKEAVAYLEMCDWALEEAIKDAKDDFGWEDGDLESERKSLLT